ncbi:hypothetical protein [Massilia pseudoviolaceinigra]|uniref:hypothetical protein n=1 Tax=Massilia pseudoviolaceinigra TaxID=3057165 RepID=UPI0027966284|nr:hypothetical protein [Massilia sp. CCM 9206]MDQ1919599.1 hypothetical protein [Massilia sp. CCM 9206]
MHNPYQSPAPCAPQATQPPGKRPLSVWLLLLALGAISISLAVITAGFVSVMVFYKVGVRTSLVADIAWRLVIVALAGGALVGVARRRQWGRWLGVLAMGAMTVALFFIPDTAQYANETQRSGGFIGRTILVPALMAWWIYACGFSSKARRYFGN